MFGTLSPHACRGACARTRAYEAYYCGVCAGLGAGFGHASRALLSYDAVFLALVADGLADAPATPSRCRCPVMPVRTRPTVEGASITYAAAMQILLADQYLADRAEDGRKVARIARPLLGGKVARARAALAAIGVPTDDLEGVERAQARCEVPGVTGPAEAAEPTAAALAIVFRRMADLPHVAEGARAPEVRASLEAFGRHLGRAIYLVDALDDLGDDHRAGAFNPCVVGAGRAASVSWHRVEAAWGLLHGDLAALDAISLALPIGRTRALVRSVVAGELRHKAVAAARRAHAYARSAEAAARRSVVLRALAAVVAAIAFVWVWIVSLPGVARGGPGAKAPPPGKAPSGAAPPTWNPRLPPPAASARAAVADAGAGDAGPDAGDDAGADAGDDAGAPAGGLGGIVAADAGPSAPGPSGGGCVCNDLLRTCMSPCTSSGGGGGGSTSGATTGGPGETGAAPGPGPGEGPAPASGSGKGGGGSSPCPCNACFENTCGACKSCNCCDAAKCDCGSCDCCKGCNACDCCKSGGCDCCKGGGCDCCKGGGNCCGGGGCNCK